MVVAVDVHAARTIEASAVEAADQGAVGLESVDLGVAAPADPDEGVGFDGDAFGGVAHDRFRDELQLVAGDLELADAAAERVALGHPRAVRDGRDAFVSLFAGNQLHIAVVTDLASGQKQKIRTMRESKLLAQGHVLTTDMYAVQAEADVEDVLGREMYLELVREAYGQPKKGWLPAKRPSDAPIRVVKEVEAYFDLLPPQSPSFDHYTPAEFLIKSGISYEPTGLAGALDRFQQLFEDLNRLL